MPARDFAPVVTRQIAPPAVEPPARSAQPTRAPGSAAGLPRFAASAASGPLIVNRPGDTFEQEADRIADAVVAGRSATMAPAAAGFSLQRDDKPAEPPPKKEPTEEEKYKAALKKIGDAFLETDAGKELKAKAEALGEKFLESVEGKVLAGTALGGALAAIIATNGELPVPIPEIPLDFIAKGLKAKLKWEGPVRNPTSVSLTLTSAGGVSVGASYSKSDGSPGKPAEEKGGLTLTIPLDPEPKKKKSGPTDQEKYRAETARIAAEQAKFREGMKPASQKKTEDDEFWRAFWQMKESERKKGDSLMLMRQADSSGPEGQSAPPIVHDVLRGPGQPLDAATRAYMEPRFGRDFSEVRIHRDTQAAESARAVNARAYTVGRDIVFAAGHYEPNREKGRTLLAHELVHTIQQSPSAPAAAGPRSATDADPAGPTPGRASAEGTGPAPSRPTAPASSHGLALQRDRATPGETEMPEEWAFADPQKRTWRRYARQHGEQDAARIRKAGTLTAADRKEVNAKFAYFEGDALAVYLALVRPALKFVTMPEVEMEEQYVGSHDTPQDVLGAIVTILEGTQVTDKSPMAKSRHLFHPAFYIHRNVIRPDYAELLWEWFRIGWQWETTSGSPKNPNLRIGVTGDVALVRIAEAKKVTEHLVAKVAADAKAEDIVRLGMMSRPPDNKLGQPAYGKDLVMRYLGVVDILTWRAKREVEDEKNTALQAKRAAEHAKQIEEAYRTADLDSAWKDHRDILVEIASTPHHRLTNKQLIRIWVLNWDSRKEAGKATMEAIRKQEIWRDGRAYTRKLTEFEFGDRNALGPDYRDAANEVDSANLLMPAIVDVQALVTVAESHGRILTLGEIDELVFQTARSRRIFADSAAAGYGGRGIGRGGSITARVEGAPPPPPTRPPTRTGGGGGRAPSPTIRSSPPPTPLPAPARGPAQTIRSSPPPPPPRPPMNAPSVRGPVAVADSEVIAANVRNPTLIRPQDPATHQRYWNESGGPITTGNHTAPLAYRDIDGNIRVSTDSWLYQQATRAPAPLPGGQSSPARTPPPPPPVPPPAPRQPAPTPAPAPPQPAPRPSRPPPPAPSVQVPSVQIQPAQGGAGLDKTGAPGPAGGPPSQRGPAIRPPSPSQVVKPPANEIPPPNGISLDRVRAFQRMTFRPGQRNVNVLFTESDQAHLRAWQLTGGGWENPPPAFFYDYVVYVHPSLRAQLSVP